MGHPMAKKGNRKRGDKFLKHQERFRQNSEQDNDINQVISDEEKVMNDQYIMDIECK